MPYKKVTPVSEEEISDESIMRNHRYDGHHTICQVCREIWRIGQETENGELQYKARLAMAMGKKMHDKLKYYKEKENA